MVFGGCGCVGGRSLKRRELFHASQPQIPRPALPYSSCLVHCYLIVPTSSSLGGLSGRRPLRVQVVAWGRQRGLARAPCRFAPCFAGVTWTSHESISDSNCSTSFITSFNHLHHHTPRGECRFQRERNSVASDLWRRTPQNQKAKRKEVFKDFRFSPSQIPVDEIFSFVPYGRGVAL